MLANPTFRVLHLILCRVRTAGLLRLKGGLLFTDLVEEVPSTKRGCVFRTGRWYAPLATRAATHVFLK